jgi:hypothetical protein
MVLGAATTDEYTSQLIEGFSGFIPVFMGFASITIGQALSC